MTEFWRGGGTLTQTKTSLHGAADLARTAAVALFLFVSATCGAAQGPAPADNPYPAPTFTPPAGHPRVYFRAEDLPRLRANAHKPQNELAWTRFLDNLETGTDGVLDPPANPAKGNMDSEVLSIISCYALDYALRGDEAHGRRAIKAMRNYTRTVRYPTRDYNNTGQTVFTIGVVYDWCYPLLGEGDKSALYDAAVATMSKMEIGWPPVGQGNVTGHGVEGQIFRDILAVGVAMYDEHPEIYNIAAGRFFSRMVEPKLFMYPAHTHHQGSHYSNYRGKWEMLATFIFDRMGLPEVFGPDQRYAMYRTLYARRPDGQVLHEGDTHINNRPADVYYADPYRTLMLAANYFHDPYLKMEALRESPGFAPMRPRGNQAMDCVELLVFNDPGLEPRPLDELPLTHYFPSPKGAMIARTGWEDGVDSPAAVVEMKINEWYFANHMHLDAGAFQIYYRGVLANDSGYYQAGDRSKGPSNNGASGYGSLHDINYNKRSIAHNVVTVYDPNETFVSERWAKLPVTNDGGQRMPNQWREPVEQTDFLDPRNAYRIGAVLAHTFGPGPDTPDYTYLEGDLTRAYSRKIRAYQRSFAFFNLKDDDTPGVLVVFDRVVSSNPDFRKAWLLHGLEEPEIAGSRTVFKDTREGYTGKLTVDTLLPEPDDAEITAIGGPGRQFLVDGVNYPVTLHEGGINEGGGWRIEVSPKTHRATDYFLNVLQIGNHTPDTPAMPVEKLETPTHLGARVGDRVVYFARSPGRVAGPVELHFEAGRVRVLVADLKAGTWTLERYGHKVGSITVTEDGGVAYFGAQRGNYRLVRTDQP